MGHGRKNTNQLVFTRSVNTWDKCHKYTILQVYIWQKIANQTYAEITRCDNYIHVTGESKYKCVKYIQDNDVSVN